jgi:3-hydroxymyristoyl/3-hydroxydecanoyl-(acyl carrier protein) dehydratase
MSQTDPAVILDPSQLDQDNINSDEVQPSAPPRELPKHLADFKRYADSKLCYYSEPIDQAKITRDVEPKVAYQCHMKILMEERKLNFKKTPQRWDHETVFGSSTIGELKTIDINTFHTIIRDS